jgi:hypothetical protein
LANVATVLVTVDPTAAIPAGNAAQKNIVLTLTDFAGVVQTANVDGTTESPAWTAVFSNVAAGLGSVSAQAMDTAGAAMGAAVSASFTEGGGVGGTFNQPTALAVTVS